MTDWNALISKIFYVKFYTSQEEASMKNCLKIWNSYHITCDKKKSNLRNELIIVDVTERQSANSEGFFIAENVLKYK